MSTVNTAEAFEGLRSKRRRLAAELVRLRDQAGLSGRQLARQVGISQSKVSRIEAGTAMPSMPEVTAWVEAVGTDTETRNRLRDLTEAAYIEVHSWRSLLRDRPHLQKDIGQREAAASQVRTFQASIVPGLLQTPDYATHVFSMFQISYTTDDAAAAVAARMRRQTALHEGGRFDFLMTEAALRWRPGSSGMLAAQLERISLLSTIRSVSIGVIPLDVSAIAAIPHGFVIYGDDDDASITVEMIHANLEVTDPADVELYRAQWVQLASMAVFDDSARRFMASLATELRRADT